MKIRKLAVGAGLGLVLLGGGVAAAGPENGSPANCFGQHVSRMAREYDGMAAATEHHNEMHGTTYTVAQHQEHIRMMCSDGAVE